MPNHVRLGALRPPLLGGIAHGHEKPPERLSRRVEVAPAQRADLAVAQPSQELDPVLNALIGVELVVRDQPLDLVARVYRAGPPLGVLVDHRAKLLLIENARRLFDQTRETGIPEHRRHDAVDVPHRARRELAAEHAEQVDQVQRPDLGEHQGADRWQHVKSHARFVMAPVEVCFLAFLDPRREVATHGEQLRHDLAVRLVLVDPLLAAVGVALGIPLLPDHVPSRSRDPLASLADPHPELSSSSIHTRHDCYSFRTESDRSTVRHLPGHDPGAR